MKTIFTLIITSIVLISCQTRKSDLTLKLEAGKEYKQKTNMVTSVTQDMDGQKIYMEISSKAIMTFLVKSVNETDYHMDVKYESLEMVVRTPWGIVEISSAKNDPNDFLSIVMEGMVNKPFEAIVSKTGKVIEVTGVEAMLDSMIDQFDQVTEEQKEQGKAQVIRAYGSEAFKGNLEMVLAIYPENPVNKGDKWNIDTKLESGMSANMSTEYEFVDSTSDYAIIKGSSVIETEDKDAYVESNGMPMKYDLKGSMTSEIKVDKNTGWIIEAKIDQEIGGDGYIKENSQMPNGMKVPIVMKNSMTITN